MGVLKTTSKHHKMATVTLKKSKNMLTLPQTIAD